MRGLGTEDGATENAPEAPDIGHPRHLVHKHEEGVALSFGIANLVIVVSDRSKEPIAAGIT